MNEFTEAFAELLEVQAAVVGAKTATIAGQSVAVFLEEATFDTITVAGGIGENGGFQIMVEASLLTSQPAQFAPVIVAGRTLKNLSLASANGIYTITAGDPATQL